MDDSQAQLNQGRRTPQFLFVEKPGLRSLAGSLNTLWETDSPVQTMGLYYIRAWPRDHRPVRGIFTSLFLHGAILFVLLRVPMALLFPQWPAKTRAWEPARPREVVYFLPPPSAAADLSALLPESPAVKHGGVAALAERNLAVSSIVHPRAAIVSNPPGVDNDRQTILQPAFPPDIRIKMNVTVPDLFLVPERKPAFPVLPAKPVIPAPVSAAKSVSPPQIAPPAPINVSLAFTTTAEPAQPALSVEDASTALRQMNDANADPAAAAQPPAPMQDTVSPGTGTDSAAALQKLRDSVKIYPVFGPVAPDDSSATQPGGLFALSLNPGPLAPFVTLPEGNAFGGFMISPAGDASGSQDGAAAAFAPGIVGQSVTAGVVSGSSSTVGAVEDAAPENPPGLFDGDAENSGKLRDLLSTFFASPVIYPVPLPAIRHPSFTITAGPTGGGGLDVYGVLQGGKIYTIYLSMPGKNWVLQYSVLPNNASSLVSGSNSENMDGASVRAGQQDNVVLQPDPGLVAPSVLNQYDFRRPNVSAGANQNTIVLQGIIREDGTVSALKILRGIFDSVDQAAAMAFSRWRFKPALRDDKAVAVQFLVGIPALFPASPSLPLQSHSR